MEKDREIKKNLENDENVEGILDKLLKLQEGKRSPSFQTKTIYVVVGICIILFTALICACIYKNNFSTESILATLLAFFSIFMSIFFYFKADDTSNKFFDSSYKFMKDISVTLGKIEERFGEKLNSLNEKVSHLDNVSNEATAEIEDKKEDKDSIINELMDKANLNEEEKNRYHKQLEEKEKEIEQLRENKFIVEQESDKLRRKLYTMLNEERSSVNKPRISEKILLNLLNSEKVSDTMPMSLFNMLKELEYIDSEGNINRSKLKSSVNRGDIRVN